MYSLLTLRTLYAKKGNSHKLSKERYFCLTLNCCNYIQRQTKVNLILFVNNAHWKIFHSYYSQHEFLPQAYTQFCNKQDINISLMWAVQYSKNMVQFRFWNNIKLAHILMESLTISVNTKHYNSVGELITKFPFPKLGGTYRIINIICRLLQAVTHSFEVSDRYVN